MAMYIQTELEKAQELNKIALDCLLNTADLIKALVDGEKEAISNAKMWLAGYQSYIDNREE